MKQRLLISPGLFLQRIVLYYKVILHISVVLGSRNEQNINSRGWEFAA
jgi:hypothetical protein